VEFAAMRVDERVRDAPGAGARRVVALATSLALQLAILLLLLSARPARNLNAEGWAGCERMA